MRFLPLLLLVACVGEPPDGPDTAPPDEDTQPPPPPTPPVTEHFEYLPPQLDLIFVVDPVLWEVNLSLALSGFVAHLEARDVDYRLGATSTFRSEDGTVGILSAMGPFRWADPYQPGAADILRGLMRAVGEAEGEPCGTLAVRDAIEHAAPEGPNEGFFRPGAQAAFVVFSDEVDRSFAHGLDHSSFVQYVRTLRDEGLDIGFHGIVDPHDKIGTIYYAGVVNSLEGCLHPLTEVPYQPGLDCIVNTVEPTNVFPLSAAPVDGSLEVVVHEPGGSKVEFDPDDFLYDPSARTVSLLDYYPRYKAKVDITYVPR